jgi:predicted nucleotidyltransferase
MAISFRLFPEACIEKIVERAIEEGKLFELLFTDEGKKLWEKWGEDRIRALVMQKLNVKFEKEKKQRRRRWQR